MTDRHVQDMLQGIAIGDAFGAGFEMRWKDDLKAEFPKGYVDVLNEPYRKHPFSERKPGEYTDDTQMSIAVTRLLIENPPYITVSRFADTFVETAHENPRFDIYAEGFGSLLRETKTGQELLARIYPISKRNGAAMRSVPLGVLQDTSIIKKVAIQNALVTHATPQGIASSVCVAMASHYILYELGPLNDIAEFCANEVADICSESALYYSKIRGCNAENLEPLYGRRTNGELRRGIPVLGMYTAGAALHLVSQYGDDFGRTLGESILLGGDTDTVAAIACGIVAVRTGITSLPAHIEIGLENSRFGKAYLCSLGRKLAEKYNLLS